MTKPQIVKCRFCHNSIDKSTAYSPKKGMYYCDEEHYQKYLDKKNYKPSKTKSDGEPNDRRELTDWIQNYYVDVQGWNKYEINWKLITAQLKNIMEDGDLKYSGILLTLKYLVDIKEMDLLHNESGSVLGLVPMNYINAKNYWKECQEIKKAVEEFEFDDEVRVIKRLDNKDNKWYNKVEF